MNTEAKANKIVETVLKAAQSNEPEKYFGRQFDNLLEDGDGEHVVIAFMKQYKQNKTLQKAIEKVNHWICISSWEKTYKNWTRTNPTLF